MKYITTPIYYVNDVPHIGHAYTTIAADVLARYYKSQKIDTFFLTGVDEHGAKIAQAAEKAGQSPKDFVDELAKKFETTWQNLNIEYSEFFRTTNTSHEKLVAEFVKKLADAGFVEKRKYEGLYCVACERYYKEDELVEGLCPDHKTKCEKQSEENYFFLLSQFQDKLISIINKNEFEIGPVERKNEILSKIKLGLEDVSISRSAVKWGIPYPGDETQTIYVWVDALLNYYTATKIYKMETWEKHPADLHLMAKDILWFHAVIWPAMLMALDLPLPRKVFAHGFFTIDGGKMSKTIGNVIDPNKMVGKFGADAVRYAILREFPFGEDGDISVEKIQKQYDNLANNIGNLLQRTIVMINKYNIQVENINKSENSKIQKLIEELKFNEALAEIESIAIDTNKYIAEKEPWKLAKDENNPELSVVLNKAHSNIAIIADLLSPFIPETSEKMKKQLETLTPEPLFPRLT